MVEVDTSMKILGGTALTAATVGILTQNDKTEETAFKVFTLSLLSIAALMMFYFSDLTDPSAISRK